MGHEEEVNRTLDKPKVIEHHRYEFFVKVDGESFVSLHDDDDVMRLPSYVALRGVLKAVRYILETGEGQSILDRVTTVMRRYRQYLPQFKNDVHNDRVTHQVFTELSTRE